MSRVLRCSLRLDRSPRSIRVRCSSGNTAHSAGSLPAGGDAGVPAAPEPDINEQARAAAGQQLQALLGAMEDSVHEAEQMRRQSLDEFQQLAVELAVTIAGELVFRAIEADQFDAGGLVAAAVDRLGLDAPLTVALHPLDIKLLDSAEPDDPPVWRTGKLTLHPDPTLPRGHCRASNGATVLLSEFAPRLEEIRDSLLEGLDDAQIERRQAAGVGSALKRFPDRRETA